MSEICQETHGHERSKAVELGKARDHQTLYAARLSMMEAVKDFERAMRTVRATVYLADLGYDVVSHMAVVYAELDHLQGQIGDRWLASAGDAGAHERKGAPA